MSTRHRVVVLLLEPVVGYDAVIPSHVLGEAVGDTGEPLYDVAMASLDGQPVSTSLGYALTPHGDAALLATADTVIVPGTKVDGGVEPGELFDVLPVRGRGPAVEQAGRGEDEGSGAD